jgi:pimeloyl-ACP methyl ester carboxylesterase
VHIQLITREPDADAHATPILFVHGMWHAAWCWEPYFLPYFAQHGFKSHALSLRGHGTSDGREQLRWTSLSDYVADLVQVIDQLDSPPILVGHSMGGMIVQKYLETHQAPVAVLLASAPPQGLSAATMRFANRHPLNFLKVNLTFSLIHIIRTPELYKEAFFSDHTSDTDLYAYHSQLQDDSVRAYTDMLLLDLPRLEQINTPMLVLGSTADTSIAPSEVRATAEAYSTNAEFYPDMGHAMMLDVGWQGVADRILAWLDQKGL